MCVGGDWESIELYQGPTDYSVPTWSPVETSGLALNNEPQTVLQVTPKTAT